MSDDLTLLSLLLISVYPDLICQAISSRVIQSRVGEHWPITSEQHSTKWCWYFPSH